jgi:hypothetical protein
MLELLDGRTRPNRYVFTLRDAFYVARNFPGFFYFTRDFPICQRFLYAENFVFGWKIVRHFPQNSTWFFIPL